MKYTEASLEKAVIQLMGAQGYPHVLGADIDRTSGGGAGLSEVLIKADLRAFLAAQYAADDITPSEIESMIRELEAYSALDLYESNKAIMKRLSDGFQFKREPAKDGKSRKDLYVYLMDFAEPANNHYKLVNQLVIEGINQNRIPDAILYINGLPLVVFEFKSAIRIEADCHEAYLQITNRYRRDIPELFKYNALCVLSDGVNTKSGSFFASYDFYYAWRKVTGDEALAREGVEALYTMIQGLFDPARLGDVLRHFIYVPDKANDEVKILCRYPQYYAAMKLFANIKRHQKLPGGQSEDALRDGKGGTYFGATGCGKSYTMLFLSRLLMKSVALSSPTIVLITDRTDLDSQLAKTFTNAKHYIGDSTITSVASRTQLRELLQGRESGGVFLTTIHKFTESASLLTDRCNVICISDEAHRSQTNLDQKLTYDLEKGTLRKTYGFAKYLHDSLPNATYVGFTGTPVDATLDVFGEVVDAYTMTESVKDEITVPIVYEGRAAKVFLDNRKLEEIEDYYEDCIAEGASEYQVEESKKASASMGAILGDPDRLAAVAKDFVRHYENRVTEAASVKGKAMFVSSSRRIAYDFYQQLIELRPEWAEVRESSAFSGSDELGVSQADALGEVADTTEAGELDASAGAAETQAKQREDVLPMERVKMIMTRGKDDPEVLYNMLGTKEYRAKLDKQFKQAESNFKIAIVVDMWLTGFDVPFLDTIYIDKPLQKHNLIQTISRVNRNFEGKKKGLVVDYIGIKNQMNQALAMYSKMDEGSIEEVELSIITVRDHLDLLNRMFHPFDVSGYFSGDEVAQLECLRLASEFVQRGGAKHEKRFMDLVKRMKAAYDICSGSDVFASAERDQIHFYLAVRSIIYKLTKGDAPDTAMMNARVRQMVAEALQSDGVEEVFKMGEDAASQVDIFEDAYLERIANVKLPNTRIKLLQQLLKKAIGELRKVNKVKGVDFSQQFTALVQRYNERDAAEQASDIYEEATAGFFELIDRLKTEMNSNEDMGISFEEKAFYDILKNLAHKYNFEFAEAKLLELAQAVKVLVDSTSQYPDWNNRPDIQSQMKIDLMMLLAKHGYPPEISREEVYAEVFEQAEGYKKNRG